MDNQNRQNLKCLYFAILHNPNGSRTINEDYRRIVSIAAILIINAEQDIAAIEGEMCVFRHGINH